MHTVAGAETLCPVHACAATEESDLMLTDLSWQDHVQRSSKIYELIILELTIRELTISYHYSMVAMLQRTALAHIIRKGHPGGLFIDIIHHSTNLSFGSVPAPEPVVFGGSVGRYCGMNASSERSHVQGWTRTS
jgi:hypothetical protein